MIAKKRLLPILVAVLIVFAMMPMTAGTVHAAEAGSVDCEGFKYWIEPDQGTAVIYGRAAGNADTEVSIPNEVTYDGENYDVTKINNARTILYLLLFCHGKIGKTDVNMTRKRCDR